MRLIDADELIETYEKETGYSWNAKGILECPKCFIDNAPTVEPDCKSCKQYDDGYNYGLNIGYNKGKKERPQGEWIKAQGEWVTDTVYKIGFKCSECDGHFEYPYNFCPNCGARMQKGGAE